MLKKLIDNEGIMKHRVYLWFLTVLLSGCLVQVPKQEPLYAGQPRPINELAIVAVGSNVAGVGVRAIDGITIVQADNPKGAEILPGKHVFEVFTLSKPSAYILESTSGVIVEEVKAGHSYVPRYRIDPETKKIVFYLHDAGKDYDRNCLVEIYPDHNGDRKNAKGCI